MSRTWRSSDDKDGDEIDEFDVSEYDAEDWVVSPEELKAGEFNTLEDAENRLSE